MTAAGSLRNTSRVVLIGLWADAALVMTASAWNGGRAVATLGDPFWWGVLLGGAVDIGLAMALIGDRALHLHGRVESWGRTVRATTALMSLCLNCAVAISERNYGLAVFHAFLPILLILLSEYQQSSTMQFNAIAAEWDAAEKAEQDAQRATDQADADHTAENARLRQELTDATARDQQRAREMARLRADLERQTTATQVAKEQLAAVQAEIAQLAAPQPAPINTASAVKSARTQPQRKAGIETRHAWVRDRLIKGIPTSGGDVFQQFGDRNGARLVQKVTAELAEDKQHLHLAGGNR